MYPYFYIFGREISSYAIFALIGALVAGFYACRTAKKRGHDDNDYIIMLLISSIGVFVGGSIMYGITNLDIIIRILSNWSHYITSLDSFIYCMGIIFGGSVFYGGLLGGMAAGLIYGKIKKFDMKEVSDICAPMVPLFHIFGRIGCVFAGCCYGIESEFGYTIHNNDIIPQLCDVNRFPVQLLEATLNLMLFLFLAYLLRNNKFKGGLFALYLVIYSVIRFFDEFLRGDLYRGFLFGLSTSQIISIILFVSGVIYLIFRANRINKQKTES